mgnify:FL=1
MGRPCTRYNIKAKNDTFFDLIVKIIFQNYLIINTL